MRRNIEVCFQKKAIVYFWKRQHGKYPALSDNAVCLRLKLTSIDPDIEGLRSQRRAHPPPPTLLMEVQLSTCWHPFNPIYI